MEYLWLFSIMFSLIIFQQIVIMYLYSKYKDAKLEAELNKPPF